MEISGCLAPNYGDKRCRHSLDTGKCLVEARLSGHRCCDFTSCSPLWRCHFVFAVLFPSLPFVECLFTPFSVSPLIHVASCLSQELSFSSCNNPSSPENTDDKTGGLVSRLDLLPQLFLDAQYSQTHDRRKQTWHPISTLSLCHHDKSRSRASTWTLPDLSLHPSSPTSSTSWQTSWQLPSSSATTPTPRSRLLTWMLLQLVPLSLTKDTAPHPSVPPLACQ